MVWVDREGDGKIAGIGKIDAKGEYSVLDADGTYSNKITAGVYTLAIRFKNTESVENKIIKYVVIENNKQTEKKLVDEYVSIVELKKVDKSSIVGIQPSKLFS